MKGAAHMAQKSCKERVGAHYRGRMADLKKLWRAYQNGDEEVEDLGRFNEYGLSFDYVPSRTFNRQKEGYFRYQLSWGGPSDEFRFYAGADLKPYRVEYWFMDWFDGAKITLRDDCRNEKLMLEIFDFFREIGTVEHEYQKAMEG
jgi:hypothetical protein